MGVNVCVFARVCVGVGYTCGHVWYMCGCAHMIVWDVCEDHNISSNTRWGY